MAAAAAAYAARFTFLGAAALALLWDSALGDDPEVSIDPGDAFLNYIMKVPELRITKVPAGTVPATSFTILFSDLEGILTPAFFCSETAALEEFIMLGCTGLVHLSHLVDAIIEEGELDTTNVRRSVKLIRPCAAHLEGRQPKCLNCYGNQV